MRRVGRTILVALIVGVMFASFTFSEQAEAIVLPEPTLSGYAVIEGPVKLEISVSPPVVSPGDEITLDIVATNQDGSPADPEITLALPTGLSFVEKRFPAGTTYNYQANTLTWLPILPAGESQTLTLPYTVSVADLTQPEQAVFISVRYGDYDQSTTISYWSGLPPQATVQTAPAVGAVGEPIQLTANLNGAGPFTQVWDLGDGRRLEVDNPSVVFPLAGTYQITLYVANPLGVTSATSSVTIIPQPIAAFGVDDDRPVVNQPVQFINESGGEPPLTYLWDFGDGLASNIQNPTHQYTQPGTYQVRLIVQSTYGQVEATQLVTVGQNPTADFIIEEFAVTGQYVTAQAYTDDSVTEIVWDMGDGTRLEGTEAVHRYQRVDTFLVTMIASNEYGEVQVIKPINIAAGVFETHLPVVQRNITTIATNAGGSEIVIEVAPPTEPAPVPESEPILDETTLLQPVLPPLESLPAEFLQPVELPPQTPLPDTATPAEFLLWYINEARRLHGLLPLTYNYELSIAAQVHTGDMLRNPGVLHVGSDGSRPAERQVLYGYTGYYGGEAVAWGWESAIPVVEFWVNSPPHRVLLLNPYTNEVGVGYEASASAPNIWYWTAEFGIRPELIEPTFPAPN